MNFLSLFSGIGGMDLGLERAGLRCVGQVEREEYPRQVLARHWPNVPRWADVADFRGSFIREPVDLLAFGDPCQRNANCWRNGSGEASPAAHVLRILDELRPWAALRENPSVVRRDAEWPWWRFRAELERRGYGVLPFRLRACCVGADHRRERLFLLAALPDTDRPRLEGHECQEMARAHGRRQHADVAGPDRRYAGPRVCGKPHGIPNRTQRLEGIGNAVDVGVAEWIGRRIMDAAKGVA